MKTTAIITSILATMVGYTRVNAFSPAPSLLINQRSLSSRRVPILFHSQGNRFSFLKPQVRQKHSLSLNVGIVYETENEARYFMGRAQDCAFSDSCGVDEAEHHLKETIHLQSECALGTLEGEDICENKDMVAEVVAHLREKVPQGTSMISSRKSQGDPSGR
jgi:hypothetical protein